MTRRMKCALVAALGCLLLLFALPGFAESQARIVRLSYVDGDVQIDQHTGNGFEPAVLNMPVTQDSVLRTGSDGRAEVEFEDETVARLTPDSQLSFQRLSLADSGDRLSTLAVDYGTAYFNVKLNHDEFAIIAGGRDIPLTHSAHFRVQVGPQDVRLAVFKGQLKVDSGDKQVEVSKNHELTFDIDGYNEELASEISPFDFDAWDKERQDYHQSYYTASDYNSYPYYGRGDLDQYGNWYSVDGYGSLWQPYGVNYGWDPFGSGYWYWYPGWGYTWISSYPWGWLPFRYGSWIFVPGWGWGWMPGSYWNWAGWCPGPRIINPPNWYRAPHPPDLPHHRRVIVRGSPKLGPQDPRISPRVIKVSPAPTRPPKVQMTRVVDAPHAAAPVSTTRVTSPRPVPVQPTSTPPPRRSSSTATTTTPSYTPPSRPVVKSTTPSTPPSRPVAITPPARTETPRSSPPPTRVQTPRSSPPPRTPSSSFSAPSRSSSPSASPSRGSSSSGSSFSGSRGSSGSSSSGRSGGSSSSGSGRSGSGRH